MKEHHTQYPQKVNVWAGIFLSRIIGPFFINGNLNANTYHQLLLHEIIPALQQIVGEDLDSVWFQQDGAPAHFGINVRTLLNEKFENRWIGRRGTVEWPARSPDLTPLDFFTGVI